MRPDSDIGQQVLTAIRQIVRRISEHSKLLNRDVGLTVPQIVCLKAIEALQDGKRAVTVARVAHRVQLSSATVSRIVERLVRAGLVSRERGTLDRRTVHLSLTDAGEERVRTLPTPLQEEFIARLEALPAEESAALLHSLERIVELMDAGEIDASPILISDAQVKE